MLFLLQLSLTRVQLLFQLMPETQMLFAALLFAPILDVFQFHIWERTKDGFASVTDQSMTNSVVSVRDQPQVTYQESTTRCMVNSFVLRKCSSLMNPLSICMCEVLRLNLACKAKQFQATAKLLFNFKLVYNNCL